jgi:hypothetical protein
VVETTMELSSGSCSRAGGAEQAIVSLVADAASCRDLQARTGARALVGAAPEMC